MKTQNDNIVDLSSQIENIAQGDGFYSVFVTEQRRNSRPARKAINELKDIFCLLYNPDEVHHPRDKSLNKLSQFSDKVMAIYESLQPKEFLRKLRKRFFKVRDKIRSENLEELYNLGFEQDNLMSGEEEPIGQELDEAQKNLIYNMLLENGVSQEEALNELIKY